MRPLNRAILTHHVCLLVQLSLLQMHDTCGLLTCSMPDAPQDAAGVFLDSYLESKQEAVVLAVDSINRLALHLDMLILQIKFFGL